MYKFFAKNNPDLSCIEVDDATYAAGAWSATVDPGARFSEDCSEGGARIAAEVEILKAINISVYPNPSSDFLKVDTDQELDELYLYAVNGERMNVRFEKGEADIRNLKNGIYILRMYRAGQEYAFKLVKN